MRTAKPSLGTFRLHLALTSAVVTATFAVVIAAVVFAPLFAQLERGDLDQAALAGIADYLLRLHESYWPVVACMIAASIASGMFLFRRMSAPLVRFSRVLDKVGRGEVPGPVRLRRTDYLQGEAAVLNAMLAALGERGNLVEGDLRRLDAALEELEDLDLEPKATAAIAALRDAASGLRQHLKHSD